MSKASLSAVTLVTLVFSAGLFYSVTHINNLENRTNSVEKTLAELVGTGRDVKVWTTRTYERKLVKIPAKDWDYYYSPDRLQVPDMSLTIFLSNKSIVYITYSIRIIPPSIGAPELIRLGVFVDPKYDDYYGTWKTLLIRVEYLPCELDVLSFHVTETLPPGTHTICLFWHQYNDYEVDIELDERTVTAIAFPAQ